jgi:predicted  nucleic acid-binding Zn-ribbon protein
MHPDLVKLLDLQAKDEALLDVDQRLDALLAELEQLDQQLAEAEQAIGQARLAGAEAERRRGELEGKIENYRKLEARGKQRLEAARTPREVQAVTTELDLARSVLQKEETDWYRISDSITEFEAQAREGEKLLEQLKADQGPVRAELGQKVTAAQDERSKAREMRERVAADIERVLRTRYERLRQSRRTAVVVALAGAACGACFTTIPLNRRSQIEAGVLIDTCESCGVILYADDTGE